MPHGPLLLLVVDDDPNDVDLFRLAAQRAEDKLDIYSVNDGEEAILYLSGKGRFAQRRAFPLPDIIITDLKMPRVSGLAFLEWVRKTPGCSATPVIVYSGSAIPRDVSEAYKRGASAYLQKPSSLDELIHLLNSLQTFWSLCELPKSETAKR